MRVLTIVGARPQFVKASVVSRQLAECGIDELVLHTGQHFDENMSDIFFGQLKIPRPTIQLEIRGRSHAQMTGQMLADIEAEIVEKKPELVLVYGDTNSTLAGALAAAKLHVPVAHVEAGLRSFNMAMPEEVNRILTDQISQQLFCPTQTAIDNLHDEGFNKKKVDMFLVGDVMYDASLYFAEMACPPDGVTATSPFILATAHRAENTEDATRLGNIVAALNHVHQSIAPIIMPIHPRTRNAIAEFGLAPVFEIIEPVGYLEMIWLQQQASLIMTDSGGVQKEAFFFNTSCLTLRDETEWTELVSIGANQLVGADTQMIISAAEAKIAQPAPENTSIYGSGDASVKIAEALKSL